MKLLSLLVTLFRASLALLGKKDKEPDSVDTIKDALSLICEQSGYPVKHVHSFGYKFDSAFWIAVQTDAHRNAIKRNPDLMKKLKDVFSTTDYFVHMNKHFGEKITPGLEVESQETVDRDFEGNWWYAMK